MAGNGLDGSELYRTLDPEGMIKKINEFPLMCRQAWAAALDFPLPSSYSAVDNVLVLGMGGSAIGGDLLSGLVASESRVPVMVCRGYILPAFVDKRTLVIASSYSGMTEETLAAFESSIKKGAKSLVITTGGKLQARANEEKIPAFVFSYPAQPRAALPFSFLPLLCFIQKLGFVKDKSPDVRETFSIIDQLYGQLNESVPVSDNLAKQIAQEMHGRLPVIYGAEILAEVARRWKTQFNENSKAWAFYEVFTELNHNAIEGYQFPPELARQVEVALLQAPSLSSRVQLRYPVICELLKEAGVSYRLVDAWGNSQLSQIMSLVLLGDYVSLYLAMLNGTDPTPVHRIDYLKSKLARQPMSYQLEE
ncbi:MAG: bifunctional phosphoglucose/phosphomannose isomerase [Chloroflexi bacterium]|nr:bifunctional phosphoglucose/phosphomannose isomerase [Chloroflexota bacterium]